MSQYYKNMPQDFKEAVETIKKYCQNADCQEDCKICPHPLSVIRCRDSADDSKENNQLYYFNYTKKVMRANDIYIDETKLRRNIYSYVTNDTKFKILKHILNESSCCSKFWDLFSEEFR